jgi:two-component system chemotaxis response regulator CheB
LWWVRRPGRPGAHGAVPAAARPQLSWWGCCTSRYTRSELHNILGRNSVLPVVMAEECQRLKARTDYVASADGHLIVEPDDRIRVTRGPRECHVRPSIDVLFRSAAAVHGARVIGVVLSGTLDDGTAGLWA